MRGNIRLTALGALALLLFVCVPAVLAEGTEEGVQQAGTEKQVAPVEDVAAALPLPSRASLQALVDLRRDLLRERREARFEGLRGYPFLMPPWMAAHQQAYEDHRDLMQQLHRDYRDQMRGFHDAFRSYYSPWSMAFHDWAERRHLERQLAQLDFEEYQDDLMFTHPLGFGAPFAYIPY
jgi:hypothetical protein